MAKNTTSTASTKTTRAAKGKKKDESLIVSMMGADTATLDATHDAALSSLLADLEMPTELVASTDEEVITDLSEEEVGAIESKLEALTADMPVGLLAAPPEEVTVDLSDLTAAVTAATVAESYAAAPAGDAAEGADVPSAVEPTLESAAPTTAKKKKAATPRMHFASKLERIKFRLGGAFGDYMLLEVDDVELEGEALQVKQQDTVDIIEGMSVKEKNRASLLFDYASGKSSKLNEVMRRALDVLAADGKLQTGDKGNLHANLIAKPYSPAAARAMGRNTINMFAKLKLINQTGKGEYVANPESLLMEAVNGRAAAPVEPTTEAAAPVVETTVEATPEVATETTVEEVSA